MFGAAAAAAANPRPDAGSDILGNVAKTASMRTGSIFLNKKSVNCDFFAMNSKQYNSYTFLVDIKKAKTQQQKLLFRFKKQVT